MLVKECSRWEVSRWDRYLGMTAAMTQVPVPTAGWLWTKARQSWRLWWNVRNSSRRDISAWRPTSGAIWSETTSETWLSVLNCRRTKSSDTQWQDNQSHLTRVWHFVLRCLFTLLFNKLSIIAKKTEFRMVIPKLFVTLHRPCHWSGKKLITTIWRLKKWNACTWSLRWRCTSWNRDTGLWLVVWVTPMITKTAAIRLQVINVLNF